MTGNMKLWIRSWASLQRRSRKFIKIMMNLWREKRGRGIRDYRCKISTKINTNHIGVFVDTEFRNVKSNFQPPRNFETINVTLFSIYTCGGKGCTYVVRLFVRFYGYVCVSVNYRVIIFWNYGFDSELLQIISLISKYIFRFSYRWAALFMIFAHWNLESSVITRNHVRRLLILVRVSTSCTVHHGRPRWEISANNVPNNHNLGNPEASYSSTIRRTADQDPISVSLSTFVVVQSAVM